MEVWGLCDPKEFDDPKVFDDRKLISDGFMDFDNQKVFADTSTFNDLVFQETSKLRLNLEFIKICFHSSMALKVISQN